LYYCHLPNNRLYFFEHDSYDISSADNCHDLIRLKQKAKATANVKDACSNKISASFTLSVIKKVAMHFSRPIGDLTCALK